MKREFLTKLLPDAPKEVIDRIMSENGKDDLAAAEYGHTGEVCVLPA